MVETITPVVHGGRRGRWAIVLAMHVAGAAAAAAAFGAALGGVGSLLGAPWGGAGAGAIAATAMVYLGRESFGLPVPVPQLRRQVPDWWRTFFGFGPAAFLYGAGLGIGFLTFLSHGTLVVVSAAALASGRPLVGALVVVPFGLVRGSTAAIAGRARTNEADGALVGRLADAASWPVWRAAHVAALGAILAVSVAAVASTEEATGVGRVAAAVLAIAFGAAAMAKLGASRRWQRALSSYRLPRPVERVAIAGVPAVELGMATLPFLGLASSTGVASLVVLGAFSGAIVVGRVRVGRRVDCGCFGASEPRDYRLLLLRNGALAAVATVAWRAGRDAFVGGSFAAPSGGEAVPAALVVLGLSLAVWVGVRVLVSVRRGASG